MIRSVFLRKKTTTMVDVEKEQTWNKRNATMVGGRAAIAFGKSKERRSGGAWRKAGNRASTVKMWNWDTAIIFVGWR
jgi:hypothetical protein